MRRLTMTIILMLAACARAVESDDTAEAPPPYNTDIDVVEVMAHTVDPSARAFWAAWGEIYDKDGSHDISAKTDEEWKKVEDGAITLVLAANSLMLPAYQRDPRAEWISHAKAMADLATLGREGADRKDLAAMEKIGADLDEACDACHEAFRKK